MLQGLPLVQLTTHIGIGYVLHHAFQEAEASEIQGQITCFLLKMFSTDHPFFPPSKNKLELKTASLFQNFEGEDPATAIYSPLTTDSRVAER